MRCAYSLAVVVFLGHLACQKTAWADVLDPLDFTSLGTLNLSGASFTIDTDALTISDTGGVLFTGTIGDQGGAADSFGPGGGVTTIGPLGVPHIAVFAFDSITLDATATITIAGHRALALLSHADATINASMSVNGRAGGIDTQTAGPGGAGGFAGGLGAQNGFGPGGGGAGVGTGRGAGGGFGSAGQPTTSAAGPAYGDLPGLLQGGSGGGGAIAAGGGGGGGALEIGALGALTIGPGAVLSANGGVGGRGQSFGSVYGGGGSGGGIRLHGQQVFNNGTERARGAELSLSNTAQGGGGRIFLAGTQTVFAVGTSAADLTGLGNVDVADGGGNVQVHGVITLAPSLTIVPAGQSLELGSVLQAVQAATTSQPQIDVIHRDVQVHVSGQATVPAGGYTNAHQIELAGLTARITGSDPLTNANVLSGTGSVEVGVVNADGGDINALHGNLGFTQPVTNNAGGQVTAVNSTLTFPGDGMANDDGLMNMGMLNLINATINGDVRSPAGSTINVAGTTTFNGFVSGAASFSGTNNLVTFNGGYSPGDSPAQVTFGGDVSFGPLATLDIELGGTTPGTLYDQIQVIGDALLGGTLDIDFLGGFTPAAGDAFTVVTYGSRTGTFDTLDFPPLPAPLTWSLDYGPMSLMLSVTSTLLPGDIDQDGDVDRTDAALFTPHLGTTAASIWTTGDFNGDHRTTLDDLNLLQTNFGQTTPSPAAAAHTAVPEPGSLIFLLVSTLIVAIRRRAAL